MQNAFRVSYSLAVAILFVLFVILGTMTFYDEPEQPEYPASPYVIGPGVPQISAL